VAATSSHLLNNAPSAPMATNAEGGVAL
jgi:hypothetical protein